MKIMLVIIANSPLNEILDDRIRGIGEIYELGNNRLLKTDLTAKDVYARITENGFENTSIIVMQINPIPGEGYWGMMEKSIWRWMKEK